jgi:UDP-glucose 4-epimerase
LAEALLARGRRVIVVDNLSTGRRENLAAICSHPRLELAIGDVRDGELLADAMDRADIVFHLAATVGVFNVLNHLGASLLNNVTGTLEVLRLASEKRKKVVFTSSSEVYGKNPRIPYNENSDVLLGALHKHRWSYAAGKLTDEFLALSHWQMYGTPVVIARLFNTIGPRQLGRYGMVVPRFIEQARSGSDITVFGDGSQTRCFTYVMDVVEWLVRLSEMDGASYGQVFNLGNTAEISILELARFVVELTDSKSAIRCVPYDVAYPEGFEEIPRRICDNSKVIAATRYSPQYDLRDSIRLTIESIGARVRARAAS